MHEQQKQAARVVNVPGGIDTVGHSSVQAWSAGTLFPFVLAFHEYHEQGRCTGSAWVVSGPGIQGAPSFRTHEAAAEFATTLARAAAEDKARRARLVAGIWGLADLGAERDHQAMSARAVAAAGIATACMGEDEVPPARDSGERCMMRPEYREPVKGWEGTVERIVGQYPQRCDERDRWARLWLTDKPLAEGLDRVEAFTRFALYLRDHGTTASRFKFRREVGGDLRLTMFDRVRIIQVLAGLI